MWKQVKKKDKKQKLIEVDACKKKEKYEPQLSL